MNLSSCAVIAVTATLLSQLPLQPTRAGFVPHSGVAVMTPTSSGIPRAATGDESSQKKEAVRTSESEARRRALPLSFAENRGQFDPSVSFVARHGHASTFISQDGFLLQVVRPGADEKAPVHGVNVRYTFEDVSPLAHATGEMPLAGRLNYLIGADSSRWITDVPTFARVTVHGVHAGAAVTFHESAGRLEYDIELAPGADPDSMVVRCDGADRLEIDASGALVAWTGLGPIRQEAPRTWCVSPDGTRRAVASRFRLIDAKHFGFDVPDRNPLHGLVIDPTVVFGGSLSGSSYELGRCIAVGSLGEVFIAGRTASTNFPRTPGAFDSTFNNTEAFVSKINAAGNALVYSTYIGSTGADDAFGLGLDSQGRAVIAGRCGNGFPATTGAYDTSYNGYSDTFVAKLNATGTGLVFGTYLGGSNDDIPSGLAIDAQDGICVCGSTLSPNFPTTAGAFDTSANGDWDGWVAKLNPTGTSLIYSTRIGGTLYDSVSAIAVGPLGDAYCTGGTTSSNFPTTAGAYDQTFNGGADAFVAHLAPNGASLLYSTYVGGSWNDQASAIAVDASGRAVITGQAYSGYPTTPGAYRSVANGGVDAFLTELDPSGASLVFSTFFGGNVVEAGYSVTFGLDGAIIVGGYTSSPDFPSTSGAIYPTYFGGGVPGDGFVSKFSPAGGLVYSTYIAGDGADQVQGLKLDPAGAIYIVGTVSSTNLPATSPTFAPHLGVDDCFFMKIDLGPGASTTPIGPGCSPAGPPPVTATNAPYIGQSLMSYGTGSPPLMPGLVVVGSPAASTLPPGNCQVYLDALQNTFPAPVVADALGGWNLVAPVPAMPSLVGAVGRMQSVFYSPASPWGYVLSDGVQLQFGY